MLSVCHIWYLYGEREYGAGLQFLSILVAIFRTKTQHAVFLSSTTFIWFFHQVHKPNSISQRIPFFILLAVTISDLSVFGGNLLCSLWLVCFNSMSLFQYSIVYLSMCLGVSLILFVLCGISLRVSFMNYRKYLTLNLLKISSLPIFLLYLQYFNQIV